MYNFLYIDNAHRSTKMTHIASALKNERVLNAIANDILGLQPGDRIETIDSYAKRFDVARGTVQNAIKSLENASAIELTARGHMGTFLAAVNYEKLLSMCGRVSMFGVMPLPYSSRYEGFATGLRMALEKSTLNVGMAFMAGANRRLDALLEGRYEFAVVSASTARFYEEHGYPVKTVFNFKNYTYINGHFLITRSDFDRNAGKRIKVGVDRTSHDQMSWIRKLFKDEEIEFVPLQYSHIIDHIRNRVIDATVWSMENPFAGDGFVTAQRLDDDGEFQNNTAAAIIIQKNDAGTANYLERFLDVNTVESVQQAVMSGEMLPNY